MRCPTVRFLIFFSSLFFVRFQLFRRSAEADADPQELFRDQVNPAEGGKVPESAHLRVELNKIDSAGNKQTNTENTKTNTFHFRGKKRSKQKLLFVYFNLAAI